MKIFKNCDSWFIKADGKPITSFAHNNESIEGQIERWMADECTLNSEETELALDYDGDDFFAVVCLTELQAKEWEDSYIPLVMEIRPEHGGEAIRTRWEAIHFDPLTFQMIYELKAVEND